MDDYLFSIEEFNRGNKDAYSALADEKEIHQCSTLKWVGVDISEDPHRH